METARSAGDSTRVGSHGSIHAELLCETVDIHAGELVLDLVSGSGTAALAAARRGADVTAADLPGRHLDLARRIADASGLTVHTRPADARSLPFADDSFDAVLSTFGMTYVPEPSEVADEIVRVCRPSGRIGLTTWAPASLMWAVLSVVERHTPSFDARSIIEWSEERRIRALFGRSVNSLRITPRTLTFRYRSPHHMVEHFRRCDGPLNVSFTALDADGQQRLAAELVAIHAAYNRASDGTIVALGDYLEVVATVR